MTTATMVINGDEGGVDDGHCDSGNGSERNGQLFSLLIILDQCSCS